MTDNDINVNEETQVILDEITPRNKKRMVHVFNALKRNESTHSSIKSSDIKVRSIVSETCEHLTSDEEGSDDSRNSRKNGWTREKKNIISTWLDDLNNLSFVYDKKLYYTKSMATYTSLGILLLSTVSSYFSLYQLNIDEEEHPHSTMIIQTTLLCMNCATALISGTSKICNFENKIELLSKYKQKLDELESVFLTEITIPSHLRKNADDFLRTHAVNMQKIMTEYPEITDKEYMKYTEKYIEHMFKNMRLMDQKDRIKHQSHHDVYEDY